MKISSYKVMLSTFQSWGIRYLYKAEINNSIQLYNLNSSKWIVEVILKINHLNFGSDISIKFSRGTSIWWVLWSFRRDHNPEQPQLTQHFLLSTELFRFLLSRVKYKYKQTRSTQSMQPPTPTYQLGKWNSSFLTVHRKAGPV